VNDVGVARLRCYTRVMETVVLVIIALVVALVAIDAIVRLDDRDPTREPRGQDDATTSKPKIIVDLSRRQ